MLYVKCKCRSCSQSSQFSLFEIILCARLFCIFWVFLFELKPCLTCRRLHRPAFGSTPTNTVTIWGVGYKWEGAEEGAGGGSIEEWKRGGREVEYKGNGWRVKERESKLLTGWHTSQCSPCWGQQLLPTLPRWNKDTIYTSHNNNLYTTAEIIESVASILGFDNRCGKLR